MLAHSELLRLLLPDTDGDRDAEALTTADPELADPEGEREARIEPETRPEFVMEPLGLLEALPLTLKVTEADALKLSTEADAGAESAAVADMREGVAVALLQGVAEDAAELDAPDDSVERRETEALAVGDSETLGDGDNDSDAVLLVDVDAQREAEEEGDTAGEGDSVTLTEADAVTERECWPDLVTEGDGHIEGVAEAVALGRTDALVHLVVVSVAEALAKTLVVMLVESVAVTLLVVEDDRVLVSDVLAHVDGVKVASAEKDTTALEEIEAVVEAENDATLGDGEPESTELDDTNTLAQPL